MYIEPRISTALSCSFLDRDNHPLSIREISRYDEDNGTLIALYHRVLKRLQFHITYGPSPWNEVTLNLITTADRMAAYISRRYGNLSILGLEQAQWVFFQEAQQKLHIHRPQPDIELRQALQGVEFRQAPQEVRLRHAPQEVEFRRAQPNVMVQDAPQELEFRQAQQAIRVQYAPQEIEIRYTSQSNTIAHSPQQSLPQYQADSTNISYAPSQTPPLMLPQPPSALAIQPKAISQPPLIIDSETDTDDDSDDDDKRADPYDLLGLRRREKTPIEDIEATYRVLGNIHRNGRHSGTSEEKRKYADKRICDIDWAVHILLDHEFKQAYDDAGAIFLHEVDAWKKKRNGEVVSGNSKYVPG